MTTTAGTHRRRVHPARLGDVPVDRLIWGSSFLLIAIGLDAFEPGLVTWLRVVLGASVLWLVPAARTAVHREDLPRLVAISVLWVAIPFTLFPLAEAADRLRPDRLVNGALPIFAVAIGSLMLRRPPGRAQALGLAVGLPRHRGHRRAHDQRGVERGDRRARWRSSRLSATASPSTSRRR